MHTNKTLGSHTSSAMRRTKAESSGRLRNGIRAEACSKSMLRDSGIDVAIKPALRHGARDTCTRQPRPHQSASRDKQCNASRSAGQASQQNTRGEKSAKKASVSVGMNTALPTMASVKSNEHWSFQHWHILKFSTPVAARHRSARDAGAEQVLNTLPSLGWLGC